MSTPKRKRQSTVEVFPLREGVKCRCPYCKAHFVWPPEDLKCSACGRVVRPPPGYARPGLDSRRNTVESIQRQADAERRRIGAAPTVSGLKKPGFLLMIVAALAVLGAAVVSLSVKRSPAARRAQHDPVVLTRADLSVFATALEHYRSDVGNYPSYSDGGLLALISDPGEADWLGPYINVIQNDGWRRPYFYDRTNGVPVLYSAGPDRQYMTADDLYPGTNAFVCHPEFIPGDPERRANRPAPSATIIPKGTPLGQ